MPAPTIPNPLWWIWTTPGHEAPYDHPIFDHPNVGIYIRFRADRTGALFSGVPPYAASGTSPFSGDGRYDAQTIYAPGRSMAEMEALAVLAGEAIGKRQRDWIKAIRADANYALKPISFFWQNFGNTKANDVDDWPNSVSFMRSALDAMTDNGAIHASAITNNPFSANARHLNRIVAQAAADFLDANLSQDDKDAVVAIHFDVEQGYGFGGAIGTGGNGWLPALVRGTAHPTDIARYENEDIFHDGTRGWTLKELYERDYDALMAEIEVVPPGGTGSAPATGTNMIANGEPFDTDSEWTSYSNSVIRDWIRRNIYDMTRGYAIDYSVMQPLKEVFTGARSSEWGVCQSAQPLSDATVRAGIRYSGTNRSYETNRYVADHPLDCNDQILYLPDVHPVGEWGPLMTGVYAGLTEVVGDFPEAIVRYWRENARRALAGSTRPLVPWIDYPGRTKAITTFAGTSLGNYTRTNSDWLGQNRALIEEGVREIKVWNTISAAATTEQYTEQLDNVLNLITQIVNEIDDEWDFEDDFNRANEDPLGAPWQQMTGGQTALVSNQVTHTTSGVKNSRLSTPMGSGDLEAEMQIAAISGPSNFGFGVGLRTLSTASRDGIYFKYSNSDTTWQINKRVANTETTIQSVVGALPSLPCVLRAKAIGDQLELYVNDVLVVSATDPDTNLRNEQRGSIYLLPSIASGGITVDNFKIRNIASEEPPPVELEITIDDGYITLGAGELYLHADEDPGESFVINEDIIIESSVLGQQTATVTNVEVTGTIPGGGYRVVVSFTVPSPVDPEEEVTVSVVEGGFTADPEQSSPAIVDFPIENRLIPPTSSSDSEESPFRPSLFRSLFL